MDINSAISFSSRSEWRKWLMKNHDKMDEVWLIHHKKSSRGIGIRHEEAVEEALCFGWIDGKLRSLDREKFALRYTPRRRGSIWSGKNKAAAMKLIDQGCMEQAGLAKIEEAKRNGRWASAYSSRRRPEIPEDLATALSRNRISSQNFNRLSSTIQTQYIFWVDSARRIETRKERIRTVVRWARLGKGPSKKQA